MSITVCEKCGDEMVCMCGQTEPSQGWPCTHGGCSFVCPRCAAEETSITCPHCGGDGYLGGYSCAYLGSEPEVRCQTCDGTGRVQTEPITREDLEIDELANENEDRL
jgi:hypothetical protein